MNIVYLIAGTYRPAGMERVLANKANWLADAGHKVTVITTDQRGRGPAFDMAPSISHQDLAVNYEADNGKPFLLKAVRYPWRRLKHRTRLSKALKSIRPDITVSMFCNDASFLPRINDGSHKVLEVHFSRFKRLQYARSGIWGMADRMLSRADARAACRFERFVVLTNEDAGYWDVPGLRVIPNALTFGDCPPAPLDAKTVIAVGRYSAQKHFSHLLYAWELVDPDIRKGWTLRIVGDGEEKEYLESIIGDKHLSDSVILGPEQNMRKVYNDASVLVLSSRYEGLPMVLLEAQAAGLPVVSYDCKCGPRDVITDGVDGYLVPEGRYELIAARLSALMSDSGLRKRMGAEAYKASERFSTDRVMSMWSELFEELCRN